MGGGHRPRAKILRSPCWYTNASRGRWGPGANGVRTADGPETTDRVHLPGDEAWLVAERRSPDEIKYYLTNHPANARLKALASAIKARWSCEQAHQQLKEELGLDHFEGRSWRGLHHHALMTMICFEFLQVERLRENKTAA